MKIAHVTATFPPYWAGTGNVAYHNARLLHERGHEVVVLTASTPRDHEIDFPFEVRRLPAPFRLGNAPLTPGLVGALKGFDIIHLHYPFIFGAELTALAARRFGIPLLITYHNDLLATGVRGQLFRWYTASSQPWVLRRANLLIGTSQDYAQHSLFQSTTPPEAAFAVLPNGVDIQQFQPGDRSSDRFALLVGGLDRAHHFKGIRVMIEALSKVPDAQAVIVGDGDLRSEYEVLAQQLAPGRIRFAGRVSPGELSDLYSRATVGVLPSTTQGEAFGMVLIEAMAAGAPVIASNLPGVRTVVEHGQDGLLVEPGDVTGLADALNQLLSNPSRAREMGSRGRAKVHRLYDWNVIANTLERLYREVLA